MNNINRFLRAGWKLEMWYSRAGQPFRAQVRGVGELAHVAQGNEVSEALTRLDTYLSDEEETRYG